MSPNLRAAADSFIYDVAMLLHVAALLGEEGLSRCCQATGWTLRQTFGHLTANYERYADAFERRLLGQRALPGGFDPDATNPGIAQAERDTPTAALKQRMAAARTRIINALEQFSPGQESSALDEGMPALGVVAEAWSRHGSAHAVDFVEAAPELARDPLVLNWAFYPRAGEPGDLEQRRQALIEVLRRETADAEEGRKG